MGLLSRAESVEQRIENGADSTKEADGAANENKTAVGALDFSAGGADIFSLSTMIAINATLKNLFEKSGDEFSRASAALYDELLAALESAFARPNAALRGENGEIKLIIFTQHDFDEKLLRTHITQTLSSLLGEAVNLLVVTKAGRAESVEEAQKILEG